MRENDLKPGEKKIINGINNKEDNIYLREFVKPVDTVYFDTFPLHFQEYKTLINKAKKDNKFPKNVKLKNLKIHQGLKETLYGIAGWGEELLKKRKLDYKKDRSENNYIDNLKEKVKGWLR